MTAAPAKVSLTAAYPSATDDFSKPSTLTYSGPAVDSGSSKAPAYHTLIRDLLAMGATQHTYVLNPYAAGVAHSRVSTAADVFTSRFVGTTASGHNLWLPQGLGTITEERYKFALYEGEFVNGFRQGFGKAPIFVPSTCSSGVTFVGTYRGQWDHGHRHGFGELVDHLAGTTFSGEWRYDRKHGRGEEVYADGSRYVGLWANGQRHGPGRLHLAEGGSAARDYAHGSPVTLQSAGAVGEGQGSALESWLAEAKGKLARVTEEVESSIPATTAGLSGVSGKAGLLDRKQLTQFKEKDIPSFAQQLSHLAGGPVELVVETDTFLAGPQSKVAVALLIEGQSQFLLAPLLKGVASVCAEDAAARDTFRASIGRLTVRHDPAAREVTHTLSNKEWTVAGNFEDPSEVILPNKVTSWLEANI